MVTYLFFIMSKCHVWVALGQRSHVGLLNILLSICSEAPKCVDRRPNNDACEELEPQIHHGSACA